MLKKSAILGLLLFLCGASVLVVVFTQRKKEQQEITFYQSRYSSESDEYLKQYNKWLQLSDEERADFVWEINKPGNLKTESQLRLEQRERLKADLDKLAAGQTDVYPFANVLYGDNWQKELSKYKSQRELKEFVVTASIVCASTGGAIFTWCSLLWTARLLLRVLSCRGRFITDIVQKGFSIFPGQSPAKKNEKNSEKAPKQHPPFANRYEKQELPTQPSKRKKQSKVLTNSGWQNPPEASLKKVARNRISRLGNKLSKVASSVSETKLEDPKMLEPHFAIHRKMVTPLNNTLMELTREVAAIRKYASGQQDRVKKLQEGYDWNIIKNFCLRIIRCIDHLENRIKQLGQQDAETTHLKEVRDELLFALESSGVEQFEPEINSDYRELKKYAEAIKERQFCDSPEQIGRVAQVIRPGYQYFIDEANTRVVRTAQVKLYGEMND